MAAVSSSHLQTGTAMGANLVAGGATFRVWGGGAEEVHILGSFIGWTPSQATRLLPAGNGQWWGFVQGAKDRDKYKFWIVGEAGGGFKRDPYARELEWSSGDCIIRSDDFPWHDTGYVTPRFENFLIYQLHVGVYSTPRWPPFPGTFLDVAEKLPYLSDLGISAIQLLPIQEFPPTFSLGYNGVDYYSPESDFAVPDAELPPYVTRLNGLLAAKGLVPYAQRDLIGEANQLRALVDLAHAYGIAVIFDVVYNHAGGGFGDQSIYFFDRQHGKDDNPPRFHKSLYFSPKGHAGGLVFEFGSPDVRAFLIENAKFLLEEFRIDGLRYDQTSVIDHDGAPNGWRFLQDLSSTVRYVRPGVFQKAEYWNVNSLVVRPRSEGGAGFDSSLTDGLRNAIRHAVAQASVPGDHPLPMTQIAESLWPAGFRASWSFVQGTENHDLVLRDPSGGRSERMPRLADPGDPRSWYARSRTRVATGLCLTVPGVPMLFMGQEFLEDKQWSDDLEHRAELRLFWPGLEAPDPVMRDFLRFTRELIHLRWSQPALRAEGFRVVHVHDENRVVAMHRWVVGEGRDVLIVASLSNYTRNGYRIGIPGDGRWLELFNSDVYDGWVNPAAAGNGGRVFAEPIPMHGFSNSASIVLPANALLVFGRQR